MLFPIAIQPPENEDQCYGVIVPDLPGCFSAGDNLADAIKNAKEAITLHLDCMAEDGEEIPTKTGKHDDDPDYANSIWAVVEIDTSAYFGKSEKINVTLPSRLISRIDEKVNAHKSLYKSRSNYLAQLAIADLT